MPAGFRAGALLALSMAGATGAVAQPWAAVLAGPTVDRLTRVAPLADGSAIASGTIWSWGAGLRDAGLVRLDATGAIEWQVAIGTSADEIDPAVSVDETGATCLTLGRAGVARMRADGTLAWAARLSSTVTSAAPAPGGGCIAAGNDTTSVWIASLGASGAVSWSRRLDVPPPCPSSAAGEGWLAGLGVVSDGRIVAGLLDEDPDTGCTALLAEVLDAAGLTLQQERFGDPGTSSWGTVRVDPRDAVVVSVVVDDGSCLRRRLTRVLELDGAWGLEFEGVEDACGAGGMEGVTSAQAWGRRVSTFGWRGGAWSVQEHDEAGAELWSRGAFDGRIRGDGTFVGVTPVPEGDRVVQRDREGAIDLACVRAPERGGGGFAGRDARWRADATPDFTRPDAGLTASPLAAIVTPAGFLNAPSCGACAGSADLRDDDLDGVADACDACPGLHDPLQDDRDGDGTGAACDDCTDVDGDGLGEPGLPGSCSVDTCPTVVDPSNADADANGVGDACEPPGVEPSALDVRPFARPLLVREVPTGIEVTWELVARHAFGLRRGTIDALRAGTYDDEPIACGMGVSWAIAPPDGGDFYFVAVSRAGGAESSLGRDSFGAERPAGTPCP